MNVLEHVRLLNMANGSRISTAQDWGTSGLLKNTVPLQL